MTGIGVTDRYWADLAVERGSLEDGTFFEVVNKLSDMWEREVRDRGAVPIEGARVSFECVIEDLPRDMMVIRVVGHVRRV